MFSKKSKNISKNLPASPGFAIRKVDEINQYIQIVSWTASFPFDRAAPYSSFRDYVFLFAYLVTPTRIWTGWLHGWIARDSPCPVHCRCFSHFSRYYEANIAQISSHLYVNHILKNYSTELWRTQFDNSRLGTARPPFIGLKVVAASKFCRLWFPYTYSFCRLRVSRSTYYWMWYRKRKGGVWSRALASKLVACCRNYSILTSRRHGKHWKPNFVISLSVSDPTRKV